MKNYKVTVKICVSWTYKIRAENEQQAEEIAKEFAENEAEDNSVWMRSEIVEIDDGEIVDNDI